MISVFELEKEKFKKVIGGIKEEMEEEYFYGKEGNPPDDRTHKEAVALLGMVFSYVKRFQREAWTLDKMLDCLKLLKEGEGLFLCEVFDEGLMNPILKKIKDGDQELIPLAAKYLAYYRKAFVNPREGGPGRLFYIKMENLISRKGTGIRASKTHGGQKQPPMEIDRKYPIRQKEYFDKYMVGQEELKKKLAMAVYHHLQQRSPKAFLMIGDTGSGKNHSIHILKQYLNEIGIKIPVLIYDASKITPNGFEGDSIKNIFRDFRREQLLTGGEGGIIYLDEICKIVMPNYDSKGENVNGLVQGQLLSMLSGGVIEGVDTSKILFILGGAFADLRTLRQSRENQKLLGFGRERNEAQREKSVRDDLIEIGMQRELLGRISTIVEMEKLDRTALKQILLHDKIGPIAEKLAEYKQDKLELIIDTNVPDMIADKVVEQDLGARGAINIVEEMLGNYNYDMIEKDYQWIRVHSGMLNGEPPIFGRNEKHGKIKKCS